MGGLCVRVCVYVEVRKKGPGHTDTVTNIQTGDQEKER